MAPLQPHAEGSHSHLLATSIRANKVSVVTKGFEHDTARLFSKSCPVLPANAPVGCPHLIDLHALDALLVSNSTMPLKAQDAIATVQYHHSESTLRAFVDIKAYKHFEFICVEANADVPSVVIKREHDVVIVCPNSNV